MPTSKRRFLQLGETNAENPYGPIIAGCEVSPTKDELRARIKELETDNARLKESVNGWINAYAALKRKAADADK